MSTEILLDKNTEKKNWFHLSHKGWKPLVLYFLCEIQNDYTQKPDSYKIIFPNKTKEVSKTEMSTFNNIWRLNILIRISTCFLYHREIVPALNKQYLSIVSVNP